MSKKKKRPYIFYLLILVLVLYIVFVDSSSFLRKYLVKKEYSGLLKQIDEMEAVNNKLEEENTELKNNLKKIEKKAREFGMQKEGEEIFRFKEEE
jgi:cell division protein FtsB